MTEIYQLEATCMVVGREGTPLEAKLVTVDIQGYCRLSNIDTGEKVRETKVNSKEDTRYFKVISNQNQTMLVVTAMCFDHGNLTTVISFLDTETLNVVKEVQQDCISDITFNKRGNRLLAVTENGKIICSKLWPK